MRGFVVLEIIAIGLVTSLLSYFTIKAIEPDAQEPRKIVIEDVKIKPHEVDV